MTPREIILAHPEITDDAALLAWVAAQPPLTVQPIALDDLGPLLRKIGLMTPLKMILADANADAMLKAGIADFLDQLDDQRQKNLDTTDPTIAARSAAVLNGLRPLAEQMKVNADDLIGAIYALGGGLRFSADLTIEQLAAARSALARETRGEQLRAALGRGSVNAAERVAAFERGEAAEPAASDLTALIEVEF